MSPERIEEIRRIRNCVPFITPDAGVAETAAAIDELIDALSEARSAAEVLAAFSMQCVAALRNAHNAIQREAWQEGPSIEEAASALQQQIDAPTAPLDRVAGAFRFMERWVRLTRSAR